jgi:hypothetical protein
MKAPGIREQNGGAVCSANAVRKTVINVSRHGAVFESLVKRGSVGRARIEVSTPLRSGPLPRAPISDPGALCHCPGSGHRSIRGKTAARQGDKTRRQNKTGAARQGVGHGSDRADWPAAAIGQRSQRLRHRTHAAVARCPCGVPAAVGSDQQSAAHGRQRRLHRSVHGSARLQPQMNGRRGGAPRASDDVTVSRPLWLRSVAIPQPLQARRAVRSAAACVLPPLPRSFRVDVLSLSVN